MPVTCSGCKLETPDDAKLLVHAVRRGLLSACNQRLTQAERAAIRPGDVYIWTGRSADAETGTASLERWTDGRNWGPSRARDEYLYYHEKRPRSDGQVTARTGNRIVKVDPSRIAQSGPSRATSSYPRPPPSSDDEETDPNQLIKQTYSVICDPQSGSPEHWHLTTYFTPASLGLLKSVREAEWMPWVRELTFPAERYISFKAYKAQLAAGTTFASPRPEAPSRRPSETRNVHASSTTLPSLDIIGLRQSYGSPTPSSRRRPSPGAYSSSSSGSPPKSNLRGSSWDAASSSSGSPTASRPSPPHTPLLPLEHLESAFPVGRRSDIDQRHLASFSSRSASVTPVSVYTSPSAYQPNVMHHSHPAHARQCARCMATCWGSATCHRCGAHM